MKKILKIYLLGLIMIAVACDVDYEEDPNSITSPPASGLLNDAVKKTVDDLYDQWFSGRFTQVTMQYWTQSEYADEDRHAYRESQRETWEDFYYNQENLRKVIYLNTNEETKGTQSAFGANENQIAVARILISWTFNIMADTWGDIPYYSYGGGDADFQALSVADTETEILSPKYATQDKIYADILNELSEAAAMINEGADGPTGDALYHGDMAAWKKFANSLRLRIAVKIKGVNSGLADSHIASAIAGGVFSSNDDNAVFVYESSDVNASPMYRAYNVDNRKDFAMGHCFTQILLGNDVMSNAGIAKANPFNGIADPRLAIYAQKNVDGNYVGMPISSTSDEAGAYLWESLPGSDIINTPDYGQILMEYAEVAFLMSELNNWDQGMYEAGIRSSMEKWGVAAGDIDAYVAAVPAASEESVLSQKYIALYMDPHTAWQEYRRTGYPQWVLVDGDDYQITPVSGTVRDYQFTSLVDGVVDIPHRMEYPDFERTLNGNNRTEAVSRLSNGDVLFSPLWWDVD